MKDFITYKTYEFYSIKNNPEYLYVTASHLHRAWQIPFDEITESMDRALMSDGVPQWYVLMENGRLCGGAAVVEGDFAGESFTEPTLYGIHVASDLPQQELKEFILKTVTEDMKNFGTGVKIKED